MRSPKAKTNAPGPHSRGSDLEIPHNRRRPSVVQTIGGLRAREERPGGGDGAQPAQQINTRKAYEGSRGHSPRGRHEL